MQKLVSQEHLLMNPNALAFSKVIENSKQNGDIYSFPTKCFYSTHGLKYPVINLKCPTSCYMSMEEFLKRLGNCKQYKCLKCGENRIANDVVYDIGFQTILHRVNYKKSQQNQPQQIYLDKSGTIYKDKTIPNNQELSKKIIQIQTKKVNYVRDNEKPNQKQTLIVNVQNIRNGMKNLYRQIMLGVKSEKNILFCRGKRAQRGGKQWYTSIYIYNDGNPFHLSLQYKGKQACIYKQSQIHYVFQMKAFYIVTNQGKKLRLFKGSIANIYGNILDLEQIQLNINSRQFFGVAHNQNYLYIVGGLEHMKALNTVTCINLNTNKIENKIGNMKQQRAAVKACYYNDKLYVIGGVRRSVGYTPVKSHQYYDFKKSMWYSFQTTFSGFNLGVFINNQNLIIYAGADDSNNDKWYNKYYVVSGDNKFSVLSSGKISQVDLKLQFNHESPNVDGYVLRVAQKPQNQIYLFNLTNKGASVNSKLRLNI